MMRFTSRDRSGNKSGFQREELVAWKDKIVKKLTGGVAQERSREEKTGGRCVFLNDKSDWVVKLDIIEPIIDRDEFERMKELLSS